MTKYRLGSFIRDNMEPILQAWEDFARTIEPPALTMNDTDLRDHARQMLQAISADLATSQTEDERCVKSRGLGKRGEDDTAAETHAEARLLSGYTVVQLVSEYRALRSSVLTLWAADISGAPHPAHMDDVTRFNEAVDQALAESVARYEFMIKQTQNMFLAILGHDLRNPLGTVVTGSTFLMQADLAPKYVLVATRMFNSARRMSKLINDLLDFTRTHLGPGMPIRLRQGSLVAVCEEVVNELRTFHAEKLIELEVPPHLDAIFDEGRIAQVLSNLIGNAIQYGRPDTPVLVRMSAGEGDVVISVTNHGEPVAPDKLAAIFDPMVRIAASVKNDGDDYIERTSLGIGLYISREIVHAHGGSIELASTVADGTTFTVTIPRLPKGFQAADATRRPPAAKEPPCSLE